MMEQSKGATEVVNSHRLYARFIFPGLSDQRQKIDVRLQVSRVLASRIDGSLHWEEPKGPMLTCQGLDSWAARDAHRLTLRWI